MIQGTTDTPIVQTPTHPSSDFGTVGRWRLFWLVSGFLPLLFSLPGLRLLKLSFENSIHSHLPLIPFISGYFAWQMRGRLALPQAPRGGALLLGVFLAALGLIAATYCFIFSGGTLNDQLSLSTFALVSLLAASALLLLGGPITRQLAFPLAFLFFVIPLPNSLLDFLEIASQHASAEVYSWMMNLSGATFYREARTFVLPHLTIVVAQECSGIRSSLVLFITSIIAGQMFLRKSSYKCLLAFAVFPLGILRNAFRIYLLSMLSAHWNPAVIHSPLHHRGGPIFFVLSLIPFFFLLIWLRRREHASLEKPKSESHE